MKSLILGMSCLESGLAASTTLYWSWYIISSYLAGSHVQKRLLQLHISTKFLNLVDSHGFLRFLGFPEMDSHGKNKDVPLDVLFAVWWGLDLGSSSDGLVWLLCRERVWLQSLGPKWGNAAVLSCSCLLPASCFLRLLMALTGYVLYTYRVKGRH